MDSGLALRAPRNDAGKITPPPSSFASTPFTARAQSSSFRSRVAWLMFGKKRCASRQFVGEF